jgi:hypothetical protein
MVVDDFEEPVRASAWSRCSRGWERRASAVVWSTRDNRGRGTRGPLLADVLDHSLGASAKLIEVVEIGKQMMTRGALTSFSITNDLANYFAIIPGMFGSRAPRWAD